jgi:uncharacterized membrane protein
MSRVTSEISTKMQQVCSRVNGMRNRYLHPVHARFHGEAAPPGIRWANAITGFMGSWLFLSIQTVIVGAWIVINVVAWLKHFDPYPFILLNLMFSTQAAYAAPLILMAGNVAAARDRELWEHDYATNQKAYEKIEDLELQIKAIAEQNQQLLKLMVERNEHQAIHAEQ